MTEDDLLTAVLDMAKLLGVLSAHFRPSRRLAKDGSTRWETAVQGDGKGFPDLVLTGPGGVLFRELKSKTGTCSAEQSVWISSLKAAGADAEVWRPADLRSGRIERELRAIAKLRIGGHKATATWVDESDKMVREAPAWLRADLRRR